MTDARSLEAQAEQVLREVIHYVVEEGGSLSVVDSPPGAGKTGLTERTVAAAVLAAKMRVCCVTPKAEQSIDLARRIATAYQLPSTQLLLAGSRTIPSDLPAGLQVITDVGAITPGPGVVISTVDKVAIHIDRLPPNSFDVLIADEAYQMSFAQFLPVADLAPRIMLVGDPGQLPPLVRADTSQYEASATKVHWPAPKQILEQHPSARRFMLPATRRFPQDTVEITQPHLYPDLPFESLARAEDRRLRFAAAGMGGLVDRALDAVEGGASMVALELPPRAPGLNDVDVELANTIAAVVHRALERGPEWVGHKVLRPEDVGCIDPHVASGGAIRAQLRRSGHDGVFVDTPEIWQGSQAPLMVVRHPLSGCFDPSEFDLQAGRLCVTLSRHQVACIIVARANVSQVLEGYRHDCGKAISGAEDACWRGYRAHQGVWDSLSQRRRIFADPAEALVA